MKDIISKLSVNNQDHLQNVENYTSTLLVLLKCREYARKEFVCKTKLYVLCGFLESWGKMRAHGHLWRHTVNVKQMSLWRDKVNHDKVQSHPWRYNDVNVTWSVWRSRELCDVTRAQNCLRSIYPLKRCAPYL